MSIKVSVAANDNEKHELDINYLIYVGNKLYSAGDDGKIKLWTPELKLLAEAQAHPCSVYCLAASEDTLYSSSNDGTVKAWTLDELKEKKTLLNDPNCEFWRIAWSNGYLYVGDDQGNIRIYNNEVLYGTINIAEPVKDMAIDEHILFTANNGIIITDLKLQGKNLQSINRTNISGKPPITIAGNTLCFTNMEGRDLIIHEKADEKSWKEITQFKGAHHLIINALAGALRNGKVNLFSGGWDKNVKRWILENNQIENKGYCNVNFTVTALVLGDEDVVYAGGENGYLARIETKWFLADC